MSYTLTTKSQVTLPKAIREHLKVAPGDAVDFRIVADGSVKVEPAATRGRSNKTSQAASAKALARFRSLRGTAPTEHTSEELMRMLRHYDDDASDPGFARVVPAQPKRSRP